MKQMFGSTSLTVFQCFTPDKLQQLVASDTARELRQGLNELFEMRDAPQLSSAGRSLTFIKEFTTRVNFDKIEQVQSAVYCVCVFEICLCCLCVLPLSPVRLCGLWRLQHPLSPASLIASNAYRRARPSQSCVATCVPMPWYCTRVNLCACAYM